MRTKRTERVIATWEVPKGLTPRQVKKFVRKLREHEAKAAKPANLAQTIL